MRYRSFSLVVVAGVLTCAMASAQIDCKGSRCKTHLRGH